MRQISISIDVFARIWALRLLGEETEDQILRRILGTDPVITAASANPPPPRDGFWDKRHDVHFPEGFKIFRTYKRVPYTATASQGFWLLADGRRFLSLNELSRGITGGSENAWISWNFRDDKGTVHRIAAIRDDTRISTRQTTTSQYEENGSTTWRDDVVSALQALGGKAHLNRIYEEVERVRRARGATLPPSSEAIVRRELEYNSSDSESYTGRFDLFRSVEGLGAGIWALRHFEGG